MQIAFDALNPTTPTCRDNMRSTLFLLTCSYLAHPAAFLSALVPFALAQSAPAQSTSEEVISGQPRADTEQSPSPEQLDEQTVAREVRSILSNRCFACHGPDEEQRATSIRFDDRNSFIGAHDPDAKVVEPGKPRSSELLRRLTTDDEDERMPPSEHAARMSADEIALFETWIEQGAKLPQHWSFVSPTRPDLPNIDLDAFNRRIGANGVKASTSTEFAAEDWLVHPVDRFVLARQLELGFHPSPPATRAELLRRLSLDLTGLPPTPEEVDAFEADRAPSAYERQVDRLLASRAYGEHWARKWLDLARYADSAGYADDPPRTIWAYRDWVIDALNANMPIDQFTIEQLAGDLLPNPTQEQLVATAFHRNTLTNNEGGTNDEEFRNVAVVDRVNTTFAVWMGVTMACAQCHTHKYDPFTHEEYFKLFAIFNQSQDADRRDESPLVELFTAEQRFARQEWEQKLEELSQQVSHPSQTTLDELAVWEESLRSPLWQPLQLLDSSTERDSHIAALEDKSLRVTPADPKPASDEYQLEFELDAGAQPITALAIRTLPSADLPQGGAGLAGGNFVVTDIAASLHPQESKPVEARYARIELAGASKILSLAEVQVVSGSKNIALTGKATQSSTAYAGEAQRAVDDNTGGNYTADNSTTHTEISTNPWWEVDLLSQQPVDQIVIWNRTDNGLQSRLDGARVLLLDEHREPVFTTAIPKAPAKEQKLSVSFSRLLRFAGAAADFHQPGFPAKDTLDNDRSTGWAVGGAIQESHLLTLLLEEPLVVQEPTVLKLTIAQDSPHPHHLLGSFQVESTSEPTAADWSQLPKALRAVHAKPLAERSAEEQQQLAEYFASHVAQSTSNLRRELSDLRTKLAELKPATNVPVMRDLAPKQHRDTFIQIRGNYKSLGQKVEPGTPAVFHTLQLRDDRDGPNRLDLARWLVDERNPLTARVWVNRLWESLFGIGIVRSSEEFGSQGDLPTHAKLLDWLACEFMREGWDNKQMLRLLVTSQTYRQTSVVTHELLDRDRENIWLARGPRVRLSAEMIRDQSLAASGLLSSKMHGSPVRPPQPNQGLKAAFGGDTDWMPSQGEDRYRRGLYTTWRRSNPYPSMATFDAPSREVCTLRRDSTNTPLQALVTLNDPGFIEAAQALGRRVVLHSSHLANDEQRLEAAFRLCTSRRPTPEETKAMLDLLGNARQQLSADLDAARTLATDPLGELPAGADPVEMAAWTAACNVLLNLDEVLMKR